MEKLRSSLSILCYVILAFSTNFSFAADTHTYLRCYYRVEPTSPTDMRVKAVWAKDAHSNKDYVLRGAWWDRALILANMFYTNIPYQTLYNRCTDTLEYNNLPLPVVMFSAADTRNSYNYLIWSVDTESDINKINRIVVFGDSLSDTNNFLNGRGWLNADSSKNYFAGRFTNGKNWIDALSDHLGLPVYNWAIAGAATKDYHYTPGVKIINGVESQVDSWITYMDTRFMGNSVNSNKFYNPKNTLFIILIGGNDILTYGNPVSEMINYEKRALTKLIKFANQQPGQINILLAKLPDLSKTPLFTQQPPLRKLNQNDPKTDPAQVQKNVLSFNKELDELAANLNKNYPDKVNIHSFDTYSLVTDFLTNPKNYGFKNTTDTCLIVREETLDTYSNANAFRQECEESPDSFLYFDLMHPTRHTHQILAQKIFCFIEQKDTFGSVLPGVNPRTAPNCN